MKKFILFVIFILCFLIIASPRQEDGSVLSFDGIVTIYGVGSLDNYDGEYVMCGQGISVKSKDAMSAINAFEGKIYSYSVCLSQSKPIYDCLKVLNGELVKSESVGGIDIVYGYSDDLNDYVVVGGSKINLQIACNNGVTTIGYPLILGSY